MPAPAAPPPRYNRYSGRGIAPRVDEVPRNAAKQIAYWGDMDTSGLTMLAKARSLQPGLTALLMSRELFE